MSAAEGLNSASTSIGHSVVNLQRTAGTSLERSGINDGVAGVDRQHSVLCFDRSGRIVLQRELVCTNADIAEAENQIVGIVQRLGVRAVTLDGATIKRHHAGAAASKDDLLM